MPVSPFRVRLLLPMTLAAVIGGAGAAQAQAPAAHTALVTSSGVNDPFEGLNRAFFTLNKVLDRVIIRPLAVLYHRGMPRPLRVAANNFTTNLGEPVVMVNDLLQGRPAAAAAAATRFAANSTLGLGGIIDITGETGLPHHDNGFGLTLGRWGVHAGPYLYLPVLGPSSLRDGTGSLVDIGFSPLTYASTFLNDGLGAGLGVASGLDTRARADGDLKALANNSTDEYAALRSFYLQNKEAQITGGKIDLNALPDFDDPAAGPATTPAAAGSVSPTGEGLDHPLPSAPGVPVGDAAALPSPAVPAEPPAASTSSDPGTAAAPAPHSAASLDAPPPAAVEGV